MTLHVCGLVSPGHVSFLDHTMLKLHASIKAQGSLTYISGSVNGLGEQRELAELIFGVEKMVSVLM